LEYKEFSGRETRKLSPNFPPFLFSLNLKSTIANKQPPISTFFHVALLKNFVWLGQCSSARKQTMESLSEIESVPINLMKHLKNFNCKEE
jgi:hypothetical protein